MTRPDYCPVAQEPCQAMCALSDVRCKIRDTPSAAPVPIKGAVLNKHGGVTLCQNGHEESTFGFAGRLFATPPAAQWVGLTDEQKAYFVQEIVELGTDFVSPLFAIVEAIEAKLKEKNT